MALRTEDGSLAAWSIVIGTQAVGGRNGMGSLWAEDMRELGLAFTLFCLSMI